MRVCPHHLTFSGISQRSDIVGKVGDNQMIVNLPVTIVPRIIGSNAKVLGMKHQNFPYIGANGGYPDRSRIVYRRTDKLLIKQFHSG
jgi:hypothetical protein